MLPFNFIIFLILLNCVPPIKNEENITEIISIPPNNNTEKKSSYPTTVKIMKSVSDIINKKTKDPAPIYENLEIQLKKSTFENESLKSLNPPQIHEVDQRSLNNNKRESDDFKPSTFLGKIGEINFTGMIVNPFLKAQHNAASVNLLPEINHHHHQSVSQTANKFFPDTDNRYKADPIKTQPIHQHTQNSQNSHDGHYQFSLSNHSGSSQKNSNMETKVIQGMISIKPATTENTHLETTEHYQNNDHHNQYHHQQYQHQPIPNQYQHQQYQNQYIKPNYYPSGDHQNIQKPYFIDGTERPVIFENNIKFPTGERFAQQNYNTYDLGNVVNTVEQHLQRPEFELEHQFRKPEVYVDHYRKPEVFIEHYKKPEVFVDYLKKPEISSSAIDNLHTGIFGNNWNNNHLTKPENVYLITHEVAHMKTKHIPHQHFQQHLPPVPQLPTSLELPLHDCNLKKARISPWKKIFHILGTAIPIGLLFAALTPKVVTLEQNNTTEPNIILHKMKADNMPIEHREGRISANRDTCEEKTICETILEGGKGKSNVVQNALWNLSKRISDEIAKKNGLEEIFAAAKRKDCGSLTC
ncbi:uncharacterized protein LOC122501254 [Leptopilina heterotoma]|uniref:uncharacterized protein LOC122501254 n=1 Tax=Leptopilina heterotoma TaxID=63436 RepID=UPI001CA8D66E|nr:uncharacterized protein LOC122501254 [Leptopilina heterotoma]